MRFITVRDLRLKPGEVWKCAKKEGEIVVTSNGRPIAILLSVENESFEEELDIIRRARALKALSNLQKQSVQQGTDKLTDKEIQAEIAAVRELK